MFKQTSNINCWKEILNTCSSFSWIISFQTRTKLRRVLKRTLGCCKIQVVFRNQRDLSKVYRFKDRLPYGLASCAVHKFQCGRCNASYYAKTDRHLKVSTGEHTDFSPLTFKKVKPSAESSMRDHLSLCNHNLSP